MAYWKNEHGMTFYSILLTLTIVIILVHLQGVIIKSLRETSYYDEISIQQVFQFIQHDVNQATEVQIDNHKLVLPLYNGDIVTIEAFNDVIRRQVDYQGHEIYVRNIQDLKCYWTPNGFNMVITSSKGETYEKIITFEE